MQQYQRYPQEPGGTLQNSPAGYVAQPIENLQQYEQQRSYQQGYSQPGPQPVGEAPQQQYSYIAYPLYTYSSNEPRVDGKLAAAVSYLGLWLTGFLLVIFVRDNRFIRFHAMQSLLFYGGVNIFYIVFASLMSRHSEVMLPHIFLGFAILAFVLINIVAVVAWFVGLIGALNGKCTKLPLVGNIAERYANARATVK